MPIMAALCLVLPIARAYLFVAHRTVALRDVSAACAVEGGRAVALTDALLPLAVAALHAAHCPAAHVASVEIAAYHSVIEQSMTIVSARPVRLAIGDELPLVTWPGVHYDIITVPSAMVIPALCAPRDGICRLLRHPHDPSSLSSRHCRSDASCSTSSSEELDALLQEFLQ